MDKEREMELKLILGSNVNGWNISENFIAEKNLASGVPGNLVMPSASAVRCSWRPAAQRMYFLPREVSRRERKCMAAWATATVSATRLTSQYLGPTINWTAPNGMTIGLSPQFGLNSYSIPFLFRFSVSYEIEQVFSHFHR